MNQIEPMPAAEWHPLKRFAFRFAFVYLILFAFPGPLAYVPVVGPSLSFAYVSGMDFLTQWGGRNFLGIDHPLDSQFNGSGDRAYDYVLTLCRLVVAVAGTLVWSLLDRRRMGHPRLHEGARVFLRYTLAVAMLGYGLAKLIPPTQFPSPDADRLLEPYGESSPMGILWTFMGASQPYTAFGGLMEVLGGLLLLSRRTTLLGALVTSGVMLNVVLLNFCYDVPVKLYSSHLLLVAGFLVVPDLPRLARVFVLHRATEPAAVGVPITGSRGRLVWRITKAVSVAYLLFVTVVVQLYLRETSLAATTGPLAGVYEVESFRYDGEELPPLLGDARRWRTVSVHGSQAVSIRTMDDKRTPYAMELDEAARTLTMKPPDGQGPALRWRYEQTSDDTLRLEGGLGDADVSVRLKKIDRDRFLLVTRGFHWVNEFPYNR